MRLARLAAAPQHLHAARRALREVRPLPEETPRPQPELLRCAAPGGCRPSVAAAGPVPLCQHASLGALLSKANGMQCCEPFGIEVVWKFGECLRSFPAAEACVGLRVRSGRGCASLRAESFDSGNTALSHTVVTVLGSV